VGRRPGPTILRWQLGKELQELRQAAGISPQEAAAELEIGPPTLSKIEGGRQAIKGTYIKVLAPLYGIDTERKNHLLALAAEANQPEWYASWTKWIPEWFKQYLGYEASASAIRTYESELVPGVLQTPDYVRAIALANRPTSTEAELQRAVELRRARQERITHDDAPTLHAVVNEAVLRRTVGGPAVMRAQLRHLIELAKRGQVTLQVLPFDAGAHPAMTAPFVMLGFQDYPRMNTVYLENGRGALYLEREADLTRYEWMFDQLVHLALDPDATTTLLDTVAAQL
jgi:transcriptional regulator with XRE-family HTH domain